MTDPAHPRPLRPLLPAPVNHPSTTSNSTVVDGSQSRSPPGLTSHRKSNSSNHTRTGRAPRQQIAVACTNCQKKKCKCDGRRPCQTCAKIGADCFYDIESGFTRSQALKRKNDALSEDNRNLRFIVTGLRGGSDQEAGEIMRRIRESHDVDEAIAFINQASLLLLEPGQNSPEANHADGVGQDYGRQKLNPVFRGSRAPTLQMLLNPPADHTDHNPMSKMDGVNGSDANSNSPTSARRESSTRSSSDPVSQTSNHASPPTPRAHRMAKQPTPLIRWITNNNKSHDKSAARESAGGADRLNALLDNLPFVGNRPAGSFPSPTGEATVHLPYISVPARPWTTVTDDDDFISQIIMLFFTWEQPWYSFVNMTTFIMDMHDVSPDLGPEEIPEKEFCSPALVNAICAMGSLSSRHPLAYAVPDQPTTRGRQFLEEAERLIRLEKRGKPKITTVQAMWLTMWYRSCSGYKFRSNKFHSAFYDAYDELGLGGPQQRPADYDINPKARLYWHAKSEIIWGMYCHDAVLAIANGYHVRIKRPQIEQRFEDTDPMDSPAAQASNAWWPYPDLRVPQPTMRQKGLRWKIKLVDIIHDMFQFLDAFESDEELPDEDYMQEATRIYHRYTGWYEALPDEFKWHGSVLPHILNLRAAYDVSVITLYRAFQDVDMESANPWTHPRSKVIMHCQSLMTIMNTLRDNWTLFRHCYAMQTHWLPAFALLFYLEPGEPVEDVFVHAVRGLREVGQKWPVAAWMLDVVRGMADEYNLHIPRDAEKWLNRDPAESRDVDASDIMLPVMIPLKSELSNPLLKGLKSGLYIEDLNQVLTKLESVRMNE